MNYSILQGDCIQTMKTLPAASVQCVVTSPPYLNLRSYLPDGHPDKHLEIGGEQSVAEYVGRLVEVFREVRRVLRDDGVLFLNLGDSYNGSGGAGGDYGPGGLKEGQPKYAGSRMAGLKPKDLIGVPWECAFALRADGWYLRSDIIWCLSGGTYVYARTQKGDMPMMIRDLARLTPATVQLWNGEKWTQLLGVSKSARKGDELELVLRSGERISCTPTHRFQTRRGLLDASEIRVGDVLERCRLPESETPLSPEHLGEDAAWFAGLYIADGNRDEKTIHIAGHVREIERLERVKRIAAAYGGSAKATINGNNLTIRVYGRMLHAILDCLVGGEGAKKKGFNPVVWRYSNRFLSAMLDGYLSGDGHWDGANNRWRLGFTRNYNLERDLRTVCARLGYRLTLNMSVVSYDGGLSPTFRGEIRMERSGHHNEKDMGEVVEIRKARCREVYDLGVADEPHVFALASGILTHNSKPNPMPESVTDRPTKAHEYIFLLSKSSNYFYDADAVREPLSDRSMRDAGKDDFDFSGQLKTSGRRPTNNSEGWTAAVYREALLKNGGIAGNPLGRNRRSVWTVTTKPYSGAHFAVFPVDLIEPCILAGTSAHGACAACGAPWARQVEVGESRNKHLSTMPSANVRGVSPTSCLNHSGEYKPREKKELGWAATCTCGTTDVTSCVVLDPFSGSGTTGAVALKHGRKYIGCELNEDYIALSITRIEQSQPMLLAVT